MVHIHKVLHVHQGLAYLQPSSSSECHRPPIDGPSQGNRQERSCHHASRHCAIRCEDEIQISRCRPSHHKACEEHTCA